MTGFVHLSTFSISCSYLVHYYIIYSLLLSVIVKRFGIMWVYWWFREILAQMWIFGSNLTIQLNCTYKGCKLYFTTLEQLEAHCSTEHKCPHLDCVTQCTTNHFHPYGVVNNIQKLPSEIPEDVVMAEVVNTKKSDHSGEIHMNSFCVSMMGCMILIL